MRVRIAALLIVGLAGIAACGEEEGDSAASGEGASSGEPEEELPAEPPAEEPPGGGPAECETEEDCAAPGACPPDAVGCACFEGQCAPTCESDADCPPTPDGDAVPCTEDGVCVPPRPG